MGNGGLWWRKEGSGTMSWFTSKTAACNLAVSKTHTRSSPPKPLSLSSLPTFWLELLSLPGELWGEGRGAIGYFSKTKNKTNKKQWKPHLNKKKKCRNSPPNTSPKGKERGAPTLHQIPNTYYSHSPSTLNPFSSIQVVRPVLQVGSHRLREGTWLSDTLSTPEPIAG